MKTEKVPEGIKERLLGSDLLPSFNSATSTQMRKIKHRSGQAGSVEGVYTSERSHVAGLLRNSCPFQSSLRHLLAQRHRQSSEGCPMSSKKRRAVATVACLNGRDYHTLHLIKKILNEAGIWCSHEGSAGAGIFVYKEDAIRSIKMLKHDMRLKGEAVRFPSRPIFLGYVIL